MEILWPALGISVIVVFVFYVLAKHWQRTLREQSWIIRRLAERVRSLEDVADPEFQRRLNEAAPTPLEQVFTFSLRLGDHFWNSKIRASAADLEFIRSVGSFIGSVKIERWRTHTVVTVTEVLPESKLAGWHQRTLDLYSENGRSHEPVVLWELPISRPRGTGETPPRIQLVLQNKTLHLCAVDLLAPRDPSVSANVEGETLVRVPLDATMLAEYRSHAPSAGGNGNGNDGASEGASWQAFYSHHDENLGIDWQLWLHDLCKKAEWERWKILESVPSMAPVGPQ